nr:MAG TPA: hypothetical protein [Caudoviricetes sp.]
MSISVTQGKRPKLPPWKQQEAASNAGKKRRHKTPRPERGGSRNETVIRKNRRPVRRACKPTAKPLQGRQKFETPAMRQAT